MANSRKYPTVALIYDFDGTLSPGNMQEFGFIQAIGKTPEEFWKKSADISRGQDASEILCYMKLMIDEARAADVKLKRDSFREFGSQIELYKGVREWFDLINRYGKERNINIEHYINSSGLIEMIEGTPIAKEFKNIYACSFLYDVNGVAVWPAVAIDYTAKTQFLFKINKGVSSIRDNKLVNEYLPEQDRPVPFSQMIYFGDGSTDIPCMRLVKQFGGNSIAVYKPTGKNRQQSKATAERLIKENRVNFACAADYSEGSEMHKVVTTIIDKIKFDLEFEHLKQLHRNRIR
ncbi:MAG: haloacid dehalogenase-like hydrolase [Bacteroidales bacterium]|nr:haloacid dehalogenase-like hydrolase [Bacteroidales bacterium]